jgi:hypothetical protein
MGAVGSPRHLQEDEDARKRRLVRGCFGFLKKAVGRTARSFRHTLEHGVLFKRSRSQPRPMVPAYEINAGNAHATTAGFRHP